MKLKSAFTLAEIVMFFLVIAVLLSILLTAFKPQKVVSDKSVKYKYAAAYDALNLAIFDMASKEETDPFSQIDDDPRKGFEKLCNGLADYINADSVNCAQPIASNVALMQNEQFDFRTITPNIVALNGIKFYFSELIQDDVTPVTDRSYYNAENPDFTLKFYMIYADLDGDEDLNRAHNIVYEPNSKRHPHVHAFAIIPTGEAIPIGVAEYNINYFATRVSYKEDKAIYFSPYYSLHNAKHAAWNWYSNANPNIAFKDKISFTYNDYIKELLERHSSQIYNFNKMNVFPDSYDNPMFAKCVPTPETPLTVFDMCGITVDTLNFGSTH